VFPKCAIYEALGILDTDRWAHFCFRAVQKAERFGMKVELDGWSARAEYDGPVVYLCNHMSTLETILLPPILLTYSPFNVVVKASLSHLPFLAKAAVHMGLVPIGRKSPREDLMTIFREGCARIAKGNSMLIFPQGSREKVFARKGYSSIGAKLAEKAGVPVMPIAVKTDCEPTRPDGKGWFKDFGTVDPSKDILVSCGPVIRGAAREMHAASFDWIKARLDSWGLPTEG
jgi:1-acyl-sn-glycerol-3-phosphate acyltransferase